MPLEKPLRELITRNSLTWLRTTLQFYNTLSFCRKLKNHNNKDMKIYGAGMTLIYVLFKEHHVLCFDSFPVFKRKFFDIFQVNSYIYLQRKCTSVDPFYPAASFLFKSMLPNYRVVRFFTLLLGYFSGFLGFYLAWIFVYTWLFPWVEEVPWFVKLEILLYQWTITNSRPCKS